MAPAVPSYRFTVPGVPVPKQRPRLGRTGTYTPARTRAHERLVWACARRAGVGQLPGPVTMGLEFYLPSPSRCDVDNLAKTVLDALNGLAYRDDRQVHQLTTRKHRATRSDARTDVCISPCAEAT